MRIWKPSGILFTMILAACSGDADVYSVVQERALTPSVFRAATEQKQTRTAIFGNPFDLAKGAFQSIVLLAMQPENWRHRIIFTPRTEFVVTPTRRSSSNYHVVVVFAPVAAHSLSVICGLNESGFSVARKTGPIVARMVLCRGTQPLSTSRGEVAAVSGPHDPRFLDMITRMAMGLYPEQRDRDNCLNTFKKGRC